MKSILLLIASVLTLSATAQPDIKKNIYIADKHCLPDNSALTATTNYVKMTWVNNAGFYAVATGGNKLSANSGSDLMVFKIDDITYDTLWSKAYGGSKSEYPSFINITPLPNGNILLSGTTKSYDMDFVTNPFQGGRALYFMEIDTAGTILKTKLLNSNSGPSGTTLGDVTVDSNGNIYATGSTWNDNMDFAHVALGKDGYIVKLDPGLNVEWIRFWIGYGSDQPAGIGLIQNGNIAVTGITGDTGTVAMLSHLDMGKGDLYVEAYSPAGVTLWNGRYGGTQLDVGRKVVYAPGTNDIYVVGETNSATGDIGYHTANADASDTNRLEEQNLWVLRLDTLGTLLHSKVYGSKRYNNYAQRETRYQDAVPYKGQLLLCGYCDGGGGDIDTNIRFGGGSSLWFGIFNNQANLIAKHTINEDDGVQLYNLFYRDNRLCGAGYSETGGAFIPQYI